MTRKQIDVAEIKEHLSTFEIHFNSGGIKHQNFAFCLGQNIFLSKHETFSGISVIDITRNNFSHTDILLYRSPRWSLTTFFNTLENLLTDRHIIDIVFGDINIDI